MALLGPPELTSSEDELFSDDGDYEFKQFLIQRKAERRFVAPVISESQRRQERLRKFYIGLTNGNIELVKEEIENGFSPNEVLEDRWNPILIAASTGNNKLFKLLLEKGASISSSRDGYTPLMLACNCPKSTSSFDNSTKIIECLLNLKVDPNVVNRKRMNALMFAANNGNLEAVKILAPVTNLQAQDNQNWNALFWAVNGGHLEILQYFLDQGLPFDKADVRNNTPLDIARNNEFEDIVNLFTDNDDMEEILDTPNCNFESMFLSLNNDEKPQFFFDVCNMLFGTRSESLIKKFRSENVNMFDFLVMTENDLIDLGVEMPFQRRRILNGIYRFHKQPFHPKSIPTVGKNEVYSNIDVAAGVLSAIKQLVCMESSLVYIQKNMSLNEASMESDEVKEALKQMKRKLHSIKPVINRLMVKSRKWEDRKSVV